MMKMKHGQTILFCRDKLSLAIVVMAKLYDFVGSILCDENEAWPNYFFCLYILLYPGNIEGSHETTFPPPQPSVPMRSHLGAFSGDLSEGESITEGFYINTIASLMKCE